MGGGYILKDNITHPRDISAVYHKKIILSQFSRVLTMVICNKIDYVHHLVFQEPSNPEDGNFVCKCIHHSYHTFIK